ncbi:ABC-F family ATP-binding cassette domain-containing protein [Fusibacter paucivorans]|uniref:ABC-F family ATP-binding cassette domain-containing protein n=1 Tax=Fusibacter paucivorans TaxID=76009 RepID=A0ABS5PUW8_9FIRM|nr:ABC-F family ATP-binding cassette domain-containing protein [Fusibacter paucivorans]MBS7528682.1 ABC-F family ATP-binding cassette domain-containing protein [Fusibacter paucivorans]
MIEITLNDIKKTYFADPVLESVTLTLQTQERIGLIGDNGSGKSTLFQIIVGTLNADSGQRIVRNGARIGYLEQSADQDVHKRVRDVIVEAYEALYDIKAQFDALEISLSENDPDLERKLIKIGELREAFEHGGGYEIDASVDRICQGLSISEAMQSQWFGELSGGERARVQLAKLLLQSPDILLLDEPTNHLDIETMTWLEDYLRQYKGSVLIVSHDRAFLDNVIQKIYELKNGVIETYFGNYSDYLTEREIRHELAVKQYNQQEREIKHIEEAAKRLRDWAKRGDNEMLFKRAKAMERRVDQMDKMDRPIRQSVDFKLNFEGTQKAGRIAVDAEQIELSIGDKLLIKDGDLTVARGEKMGFIGANGTGKTTLFKAILAEQPPFRVNPSLCIGYLPQVITFESEGMTLLETYNAAHPQPEGDIRNKLARYGFYGEDVFKRVENLSGGEKMRLMLAILVAQDINCLILDEPTNHIDIRTREIVETAVNTFDGTVLFISHDRYFLKNCATSIAEIYKKHLLQYGGDFEMYQAQHEQKHAIAEQLQVKSQNSAPPQHIKPAERRENEMKLKNRKERQTEMQRQKLETEIDALNEVIAKMKAQTDRLENDYEVLLEHTAKIEAKEAAMEALMEKYYAL